MGVNVAFLSLLVPATAYSFCSTTSGGTLHVGTPRCSSNGKSSVGRNPHPPSSRTHHELTATISSVGSRAAFRGRTLSNSSEGPRCLALAATAGKSDAPPASSASGSAVGKDPRRRVSRALNRALGNILATGDMFGSVSKDVTDDNSFGKHFASGVGQGGDDLDENDDNDDVDDDDDDDDDDEARHEADVEDLFAGGDRLSLKKFGRNRRESSKNRLLRAKTEASAAVVVDGPFSKLQAYMTLPVSEYSLLDSSIIRRVSETSFRFQIPLKDFVGLDFTPTMEVEVELDSEAKAVVFRSTRSTLYGNVGKPGEEATADPWPEATSSKVEYFRVGFDARLRWVDGDASLAPRKRGRGAFSGSFTRRPRPAPPAPATATAEESMEQTSSGVVSAESGGSSVAGGGDERRVVPQSSLASAGETGVGSRASGAEKAEPATLFCETEIKVQVLLPPPYNTLLPWRLVRVLLGKLLSTIVAYVLPRFLELLADDFYGWQSGTRRAAATASETGRTLLGAKGGGDGSSRGGFSPRGRPVGGGSAPKTAEIAPSGQERARWRGGLGRTDFNNDTDNSNSNGNSNNSGNNRNPVVGGFQRLRNVRGPGGDRGKRRGDAAASTDEDAGRSAAEEAATSMSPGAAPMKSSSRKSAPAGRPSSADPSSEWAGAPASASAPSARGESGDGFNFEVGVEELEQGEGEKAEAGGSNLVGEEREGGDRQQSWRRGWMGGGDRGGGNGGGGSINWWG